MATCSTITINVNSKPPSKRQKKNLPFPGNSNTLIIEKQSNDDIPISKEEHQDNNKHETNPNETNLLKRKQQEVEDTEVEDVEDGFTEYSRDIFKYYQELENAYMPDPNFMVGRKVMVGRKGISWDDRRILINWLVEVNTKFNFLPETLYLAINLMDRFLSVRGVRRDKFQLLGISSFLVAAKYEEVFPPAIASCVELCGNIYDAVEIKETERDILHQLNFKIGWPGPMSFLRRCSKADDYDYEIRNLAKYLIELTLLDERFLNYPISQSTAAGYILSKYIYEEKGWTPSHENLSGYKKEVLLPLMELLIELVKAQKKGNSIYDKYNKVRFLYCSYNAKMCVDYVKLDIK